VPIKSYIIFSNSSIKKFILQRSNMLILIINVYSHQALFVCSTELVTNLQCEYFLVKYK